MNKKIFAFIALTAGLVTIGMLLNPVGEKIVVDKFAKMADEINSDFSTTWQAEPNPKVKFDLNDPKEMFNLIIDEIPEEFDQQPTSSIKSSDLPENFDPREKWPSCESLKEIRDQSACGSCWAFGAASAMSDRLCIQSGQTDQRRVSTGDILACCKSCGMGCNGGYLYETWAFWKNTGVSTGGLFDDKRWCTPYPFPPCNHHSDGPFDDCSKHDYHTPKCLKECSNKDYKKPYGQDKMKADSVYAVKKDENSIKTELFERGSVEAAFTVYEDFLLYKSGVYQHKKGSALGGHAIKIMGWGVENGVKYWLAVNSWNEAWGDRGTFKILRGKNHCGIENNIVAGIAKLN